MFDEANDQTPERHGHSPQFSELERKLKLLWRWYARSAAARQLAPHIRQQHMSMFGGTLFGGDVNPHSLLRSRSGLIVTEQLMFALVLDDIKPEKFQAAINNRPAIREWADIAYREWSSPASSGTPGRWWPLPVVYGLLPGHPRSTIRSVVIGLEAMGVIEKRNAIFRLESEEPHQVNSFDRERRGTF
jgi:hypothetical protein